MNEAGKPRLRLIQVDHPEHSLVHCPFSSVERKIVSNDSGRTKVAVERDENRVFPTPDSQEVTKFKYTLPGTPTR